MKHYVLGFAFNPELSGVILMLKSRPDWQAGKFNGIGGHIEEGESPFDAMVREFREETGIDHPTWARYCIMSGPDFQVDVFAGQISPLNPNIDDPYNKDTSEPVGWAHLPSVLGSADCYVGNLRWLVAAALDYIKNPHSFQQISARYA